MLQTDLTAQRESTFQYDSLHMELLYRLNGLAAHYVEIGPLFERRNKERGQCAHRMAKIIYN